MKIKPASKNGGVLIELAREEAQISEEAVGEGFTFKLRKILVPVDFSACCQKALQYAIPLAKQFAAELILLHVVEPYPILPEFDPYHFETSRQGGDDLRALKQTLDKVVACTTSLREGTPHLEITEAARSLGADLIVISTHGRKGLTRRVFGSTTEKVVRYAPCPVLVVRERQHDFVLNTRPLEERK